jgi:aminoglycoside phosphotransferase (APT) family kinase protein
MSDADADIFSGTKPVDPRYMFDEAALLTWMVANVDGFSGPMQVFQFKGGQSNPTYQLRTPGQNYVLRRKPPGKLLPSAHAVDREFKVISGLYPTGFPVAKPFGICMDESIIGTIFYIMDSVEGRILWDGTLPDSTIEQRGAIYKAKINTLAALHNTDYQAIGLQDFGKAGSYFSRQISRWTKQYQLSETVKIPEMDRLIEWLPTSIPSGETTAIVHGDYRIDNMILHPTEPRVLAVLDWELSTLGDPLGDFTYHLMNWVMPAGQRSGLSGLNLEALGIPSMETYTRWYCEATGRPSIENIDWYFAYNLFRLGGIIQGIVGRLRDGTAASVHAQDNVDRVLPLAQSAYSFALKAGMTT